MVAAAPVASDTAAYRSSNNSNQNFPKTYVFCEICLYYNIITVTCWRVGDLLWVRFWRNTRKQNWQYTCKDIISVLLVCITISNILDVNVVCLKVSGWNGFNVLYNNSCVYSFNLKNSMHCECAKLLDKMKYYMEINVVSSCGLRNKLNIKTRSSNDRHLRLQNLGINCYHNNEQIIWNFYFERNVTSKLWHPMDNKLEELLIA